MKNITSITAMTPTARSYGLRLTTPAVPRSQAIVRTPPKNIITFSMTAITRISVGPSLPKEILTSPAARARQSSIEAVSGPVEEETQRGQPEEISIDGAQPISREDDRRAENAEEGAAVGSHPGRGMDGQPFQSRPFQRPQQDVVYPVMFLNVIRLHRPAERIVPQSVPGFRRPAGHIRPDRQRDGPLCRRSADVPFRDAQHPLRILQMLRFPVRMRLHLDRVGGPGDVAARRPGGG